MDTKEVQDDNMGKARTKGLHLYESIVQIDGCSLDALKARMKAFADPNEYEIVGEYTVIGSPAENWKSMRKNSLPFGRFSIRI